MANIDDDTGMCGKGNDFESAASYLLPKDPVARNKTNGNHVSDETSDMDGRNEANVA